MDRAPNPMTSSTQQPPFWITRRPGVRRALIALWIVVCVLGGLLVLELTSRALAQVWHVELINRHMQPYLMTGGYFQTPLAGARESEVMHGLGAPEMFGYTKSGSAYVFDFGRPVSSIAERGVFLFQDRSPAANRAAGESVAIYAVGGSAAYGIGASERSRRWFEILEGELTTGLGRPVRVIPAANPGYVSTQERLILDFMVLPRTPDAVIILNGWNDAMLPATFGTRPGDPYDQGLLYQQFYSPTHGLWAWLAQRSHLARLLLHRSLARAISLNREQILSTPGGLQRYAQSVSAVYWDNVSRMLKRCDDERIPCVVFLQPSLDLARAQRGVQEDANPFAMAGYGAIVSGLGQMDRPEAVHDFSTLLSGPEREAWFIDSVHFNDAGHAAVARAMLAILQDRLMSPSPASSPRRQSPQ